MTPGIQGLIVPAITPAVNSSVDLPGLRNLMEFLIDGGVDSIFVLGTTGEFQRLSFAQKRQVIACSAEAIRKRVPILVGISAETIDETLLLIESSEGCGVQALALAPLFGETNPAELINTVIQNSSLPIVLYNNPAIHGNTNLPLSMVEEFASLPNVVGIKDSSGDWDYFEKLLLLRSPEFCIIQGNEPMILSSIKAGSAGIVAGVANVVPELFKQILLRRDQETMDRIIEVKSEIKRPFGKSIPGIKHRLVQLGVIESVALFDE